MRTAEERLGSAAATEQWTELAAELKAAREQSGLTIAGWLDSRGLKYSVSHISNIENGRGKPRLELVDAYDDAFCGGDKRLVRLWEAARSTEKAEKRAQRAAIAQEKGLHPLPLRDTATVPPPVPTSEPLPLGQETGGTDAMSVSRPQEKARKAPLKSHPTVFALVMAAAVAAAITFYLIVAPTNPSLEAFAQAADEICGSADRPLEDTEAQLRQAGNLLERRDPRVKRVLERQVINVEELTQDQIRRFKALDLPSGRAGEAARDFVKSTESAAYSGLAVLREMDEKVVAGEFQGALQQLRNNRNDFDREAVYRDGLARQIGARHCARVRLGRPWGRRARGVSGGLALATQSPTTLT